MTYVNGLYWKTMGSTPYSTFVNSARSASFRSSSWRSAMVNSLSAAMLISRSDAPYDPITSRNDLSR